MSCSRKARYGRSRSRASLRLPNPRSRISWTPTPSTAVFPEGWSTDDMKPTRADAAAGDLAMNRDGACGWPRRSYDDLSGRSTWFSQPRHPHYGAGVTGGASERAGSGRVSALLRYLPETPPALPHELPRHHRHGKRHEQSPQDPFHRDQRLTERACLLYCSHAQRHEDRHARIEGHCPVRPAP